MTMAIFIAGCVPYEREYRQPYEYGGVGPPPGPDFTIVGFGHDGKALNDQQLAEVVPILRRLRGLYLGLGGQPVTDDSVTELLKLKNLRGVNVAGTQVSLGALERLHALPNLEAVAIADTASDLEIAQPRRALPRVRLSLMSPGKWNATLRRIPEVGKK